MARKSETVFNRFTQSALFVDVHRSCENGKHEKRLSQTFLFVSLVKLYTASPPQHE